MSHITLRRWRTVLSTWGPVLLLMVAIFFASAQPKHVPPERDPDRVYISGLMPVFVGSWEVLIKKGAHVFTYAVLAVLLLRALRRADVALREASLYAILLAVSFALTDELHQAFVPGRHASVLDIGFDYVGAASAALLARFWLAWRSDDPAESTRPRQRPERAPHSEIV